MGSPKAKTVIGTLAITNRSIGGAATEADEADHDRLVIYGTPIRKNGFSEGHSHDREHAIGTIGKSRSSAREAP